MKPANNRLPYNMEYDQRYIKLIRLSRNKTQVDFSEYMGIDPSTIAKLETRKLAFTAHYEKKLKYAIQRLRISNAELASIKNIIELKERKGYK
ncbi:helix-turn-helix transcriptional regulator [Mesobacillus subterraneus]|uniref:helix-turn-helix domain-containing protein n=1 Tax=Mesobacillus subterraneus TaxID=285983 RepID=UPI001CFCCF0F|nr:helix-turn-helix transcriptional regulator [Mesobacillus subterraneus]WLR56513.1 helix-turn-helix transcriptional regulator [Mesobacillus subterraneus]